MLLLNKQGQWSAFPCCPEVWRGSANTLVNYFPDSPGFRHGSPWTTAFAAWMWTQGYLTAHLLCLPHCSYHQGYHLHHESFQEFSHQMNCFLCWGLITTHQNVFSPVVCWWRREGGLKSLAQFGMPKWVGSVWCKCLSLRPHLHLWNAASFWLCKCPNIHSYQLFEASS